MGKLFGDYVREKRKALQANDPGYSIRGVARRLGIHHSYLSKIERGEQASLSATKLVALANILGIDSDTLLAMDGKLSHDVQRAVLHCPEIFPRLVQALQEPRPDSESERARFLGPHFRRFQRDLDLMVRNSSLGMCICMRDGVLLEANPGLARLLECPLEELPGVSLRRLLSGLGQNFWSDCLRRLETGEAESVQQGFLHPRPGGGSRWMDLRLVRLPDGGGEFYRLFGMLGDKTDAHEDQLRLLRNAELHQTLVEALHEGVWQVDSAGVLTFVSASLARLLGCGQAEMLGRPLTDFLDSGTARQFRLDLARQGFGPRVRRDGMLLSRQGRGVSALLESLPWFDGQGRFAGGIGAVLRAEDARWARRGEAAAYRQLRVIADNLRQHVHYVDADGICRFANALFEEACGVGRDGCIGHPVRQLLGAECSRQAEPLLRRVLTGERVYAERVTLALPQGARLMDVLCLPDRTEHGEVLGGYVLARESAAGRGRPAEGELLPGLSEYYGALPVAAWVVDADLRVLWANRIHQDLCGPWVGQRCYEARDGRETPCPGCPCGKAFQGGRCVSRGQVHVCRDEVCMDFIVHAGGCAWDEAGRPTQVLCLACDVTDLQRRRWSLRERLRELEGMEHIRRVALRAPSLDALYQEFVEVIAPRILSAGRRTAVLLEMDGQVWGNVRGPVGQALSAVVRVGGMNRGRLVLVHEERPGAGRGPGQAAVDRFAEVLGLVTYHMEIRAALTQSELRYRVLADDLMDFVCRFRLDGHITQANRAFALHLGTSPERLQGENFYTLHRDEGAGLRELVATLARGGRGGSVEIHAQSPTAEKRLLCWTLRILGGTEEALREIQAVGRVQRLDNGGGASVHTVRETV